MVLRSEVGKTAIIGSPMEYLRGVVRRSLGLDRHMLDIEALLEDVGCSGPDRVLIATADAKVRRAARVGRGE